MSDSESIEREGVDLLTRLWGIVENGNVDLAIDAWLEAGQQMVQQTRPGEPIPRGERLGIARRWSRERR